MRKKINEILWSEYQAAMLHRGWLIAEILEKRLDLAGARIADLGCGHGGASLQLAERGAVVAAVDRRADTAAQLQEMAQKKKLTVTVHAADIETWQPQTPVDAVVLWDVLEHIAHPLLLLQHIRRFLKPKGFLLLATPNKWSPLNLLCDPHYSLPGIACCKRTRVYKIVVQRLHWFAPEKTDIAQLISWRELHALLHGAGFNYDWVVKEVSELALQNPASIWNRPWHLRLIHLIMNMRLSRIVLSAAPKKPGLLNQRLLPTFYVLASKR